MSKKDGGRSIAKIKRKIRWYYFRCFQEKKRRLWMYRSYRHYLRQTRKGTVSVGNDCFYLTKEVHPGAGIGDQLASWISGYYYAKKLGVSYAYSRLYPDKWEHFIGFAEDEVSADVLCKEEDFQKVKLPWFDETKPDEWDMIGCIMTSYQGKKVVFYLELNQIYTEQYGVMDDLKAKFNRAHPKKQESLIYENGQFNIAVHIRRGDIERGQVTGESQLTKRWLDNDYYQAVLERIIAALSDKDTAIYIFSQGKEEDFKEFAKYRNVHYCMDMPATDSFLHMVRADLLVTSKSSFSYKPALLSDGIRVCPAGFWHGYPKEDKWIVVDTQSKDSLDGITDRIKKIVDR